MHPSTPSLSRSADSPEALSPEGHSPLLALLASLTDDLSSDLADAVLAVRDGRGAREDEIAIAMGLASALRTVTTICCQAALGNEYDLCHVVWDIQEKFDRLSLNPESTSATLLGRALRRAKACAGQQHERATGEPAKGADYLYWAKANMLSTSIVRPASRDTAAALPLVDAAKYETIRALILSLLLGMERVIEQNMTHSGLDDEMVGTLFGCIEAGIGMIGECHEQPLRDALGLHSSTEAMRLILGTNRLECSGPLAKQVVRQAMADAIRAGTEALSGRAKGV